MNIFAVSKQDFVEMIIHHIATIALMAMSWSANMVRVGTLVLCVHDAVDYILEVIVLFSWFHAVICNGKLVLSLSFICNIRLSTG